MADIPDQCSPAYEEQRLTALAGYEILDTPEDAAFDEIAEVASLICEAPIAVINFVDRDRQWFKSVKGLGVRETPLDISICAHAILQPGLFVVPDTTLDARFINNPLVTGEPYLRFYAGALLESHDGLNWSNWSGHPDKPHTGGIGGVHDQENATSVLRRIQG